MRWFARQFDPQPEAEQTRIGPLSTDADKVSSQYTTEVAKQTLEAGETLHKYGLDFNVVEMAKAMDRNDATALTAAGVFMHDVFSLGRGEGGPMVKEAGEQLSKRFWIERGENVAKDIPMADWLATAKNGSRGIVMEVFTGGLP